MLLMFARIVVLFGAFCIHWEAITAAAVKRLPRSQLKEGITPKIINGYNTTRGRFPYYTGLWDPKRKILTCGGTLIAPDVVLSAGHCWLGPKTFYVAQVHKYDYDNPLGNATDYESFKIDRYMPHPYYSIEAEISSDFMLLFLNGTTSTPPLKTNRDGSVPEAGQEITSIGLGVTDFFFFFYDFPAVLQGVTLASVPNNACARTCDLNYYDELLTYEGLITNDSLCAWKLGSSTCYGDSGGPLLVQGSTPEEDVQVGVVSWGFSCFSDIFPGVFARVSKAADWIDSNVCKYSKDPPAWFNCKNRTFPPDLVIPTNPVLPGNTYPITVEIQLDSSPTETWWFILNSTGHLIFIVPRYTYGDNYTDEKVVQVLHLPIGQTYIFVIKDEDEDGISYGGYRIRLGDDKNNGKLLASNFNFTDIESRTNFTLPSTLTSFPTGSPTSSRAPSISPAPTLPVRIVTLTINFGYYSYPSYFGYSILNEDGDTVVEVPYYSFGYYNITVETMIRLPKNENYTFVFMSLGEYLRDGNYSLVLGPPGAGGPLLLFSNGTFSSENSTSSSYEYEERTPFFVPNSFTAVPSLAPSDHPSLSPTITMRPTGPLQALTFTINFAYHTTDYFGYVLLDSRNRTVINETYGTFEFDYESAVRVLHVPSEQEYTFILSNEFGYDLYPGNFTIALGLPDERGPVLAPLNFTLPKQNTTNTTDDNLVNDDFFSSNDDSISSQFDDYIVVTFYVPSTFTSTPSMAPTFSMPVTLYIDFAGYPSEIAYRLSNENEVEDIVYAPFGTYGFANKTIEHVFNLPAGSKNTFTIYDYFGDGGFPGKFSLTVGTPGSGSKTIVSKVGIKGFKEVYPFTLEYSSPTDPKPSSPNVQPSPEPSFVLGTAPPSAMFATDQPTIEPSFVIPATGGPISSTPAPSFSIVVSNATVGPVAAGVPSLAPNTPTRVQKLKAKDSRHPAISKTATGRGKQLDSTSPPHGNQGAKQGKGLGKTNATKSQLAGVVKGGKKRGSGV